MPLHWRFKVWRRLANCPEARNCSNTANVASLKEFLCGHYVRIESTMMTHKQNKFLVLRVLYLYQLSAVF